MAIKPPPGSDAARQASSKHIAPTPPMISRFLLTAALAVSLTGAVQAAEKKGAATPAPAPTENVPNPGAAKKADPSRPLPFHGRVSAVDPAGKSFSLKGSTKD